MSSSANVVTSQSVVNSNAVVTPAAVVVNTTIDNGPVPLTVNSTEMEDIADPRTPLGDNTETIEDEKTPKANLEHVWWSWIPLVGAIASIKETHDRRKKEKEEAKKAAEEEKQNRE